ncbi:hypothetical protein KOR42_53880 [Thalassoglobus neptunius]|uniref:Uncharacterized protein n=1 Tax=Thalassoglobus neptunius TaxID=1938619 RepID=A0A5C5V2G2_9PLAN|nr:hypothetical protein KOR42_53880 [Thalassoglobus neptunius]
MYMIGWIISLAIAFAIGFVLGALAEVKFRMDKNL